MSKRILSVGAAFPTFSKKAVVSIEAGKEFGTITSEDHKKAGKWMVMFWYPKDFTFVCPTEIVEFDSHIAEFEKKNTVLIGASTDSEFSHLGWRVNHPDLKGLKTPLLADTSKSLAEELGILTDPDKVAYRATYIVDPTGTIRWVCQNDLDVGRDIPEVLRVLDALQTGKLTPCNWKPGEKTLN